MTRIDVIKLQRNFFNWHQSLPLIELKSEDDYDKLEFSVPFFFKKDLLHKYPYTKKRTNLDMSWARENYHNIYYVFEDILCTQPNYEGNIFINNNTTYTFFGTKSLTKYTNGILFKKYNITGEGLKVRSISEAMYFSICLNGPNTPSYFDRGIYYGYGLCLEPSSWYYLN